MKGTLAIFKPKGKEIKYRVEAMSVGREEVALPMDFYLLFFSSYDILVLLFWFSFYLFGQVSCHLPLHLHLLLIGNF